MRRTEQAVLILAFTAFSWLAMQAVHEGGHALGAVLAALGLLILLAGIEILVDCR